MSEEEFISLIEDVLEVQSGSIRLSNTLEEVDWDSLSNLTLISMLDQKYGLQIGAQRLQDAQTVEELYSLVSS
jgi:acyl carrier protein